MNNPAKNEGRPHKSTTHEERYYHVQHDGTVFFRKEADGWYGATVIRDERDTFVRSVGRNSARRKYFQQPRKRRAVAEPSYDLAQRMVGDLWMQRLQHHSEFPLLHFVY